MVEAGRAGLFGMLLAGASGCRAQLPVAEVVQQIEGYFDALGIEPDSVHCDRGPPRTLGATVECRVVVDGEPVAMVVEVTSDEGDLTLRPREATLVTTQVEAEIAQSLRARDRAVARVRCRGQLWVARAGARHRCVVELEDGEHLSWVGTFSGRGSEHRAEITPLPEPRGP